MANWRSNLTARVSLRPEKAKRFRSATTGGHCFTYTSTLATHLRERVRKKHAPAREEKRPRQSRASKTTGHRTREGIRANTRESEKHTREHERSKRENSSDTEQTRAHGS